ncbi:MAG: helix-turn-helix domain-containing protein [Rhodothermales bacterium]
MNNGATVGPLSCDSDTYIREGFFTQDQLAERWRVSRRTVDNEVESGALPVTYIRGSRRFAREHVVAYEACHTTYGPRNRTRGAEAKDTSSEGNLRA